MHAPYRSHGFNGTRSVDARTGVCRAEIPLNTGFLTATREYWPTHARPKFQSVKFITTRPRKLLHVSCACPPQCELSDADLLRFQRFPMRGHTANRRL